MINLETFPMTGFETTDNEHKEQARLFNHLFSLINKEHTDENDISVALTNIITFIRAHFSSEEQLMTELSFPDSTKHKAEHMRILNDIQISIMHWRSNKNYKALKDLMEVQLPDWFLNHIQEMDTKFIKFSKQ